MNKTKNFFMSHHNVDEAHIQKLKGLLARKGYNVKNSSIDSSRPNFASNEEYVKRLLRLRIRWAGTFVCLIGHDTHTRDWVNWEIKQAHLQGKRIVGVFTHGARQADVPENLNKYGNSLVTWNGDNIVEAIEGGTNWCNADGSRRSDSAAFIRTTC
jgi:hypothetical protein